MLEGIKKSHTERLSWIIPARKEFVKGAECGKLSGVMYVKANVLKSNAGRIRDWSILSAYWPKGIMMYVAFLVVITK